MILDIRNKQTTQAQDRIRRVALGKQRHPRCLGVGRASGRCVCYEGRRGPAAGAPAPEADVLVV